MAAIQEREIPMPSRGENGRATVVVSIPTDDQFQQNDGSSSYPYTLPPIIFLHGSFHGAWCWEEHYIPYFTQLGYPVVALNLRGAGDNDETPNNRKITIQEHCEDFHCFLQQVPSLFVDSGKSENTSEEQAPPPEQAPLVLPLSSIKPILISHSFGGIVVMKYLEGEWANDKPKNSFSAIITMCSLPPSGMSRVSKRMMWRSLGDTWKMVQGMAMKKFVSDPALCRDMFFGGPNYEDDLESATQATNPIEAAFSNEADASADASADAEEADAEEADAEGDANTADTTAASTATSVTYPQMAKLSDHEVKKYQEFFARDTRVSTDTKNLPWPSMKVDRLGRAPYADELPPCLVVGGKQDFMVDEKGCLETANYFGYVQDDKERAEAKTEETAEKQKQRGLLMVDGPHDLMLIPQWKDIADELQSWLQSVM